MRKREHLKLTQAHCVGLREAIRPFADAGGDVQLVVDFCSRLYLALYSLEADPDLGAVDFRVNPDEIMVINNYLSAEDGEMSTEILRQTRQVLYELVTGRDAVQLAPSEETQRVLDAVVGPAKDDSQPAADEKACDWDPPN